MDDEIARLSALLEEERRRRKKAEKATEKSRPQTLREYLEACHSLSLAIHVVTDRPLTTRGDTTSPTGRIFPRRIIPWDDYPTQQENIWDRLLVDQPFCSDAIFPSSHQLDYVASLIRPVTCKTILRYFERDTVENTVQKLVNKAYNNKQLRVSFSI